MRFEFTHHHLAAPTDSCLLRPHALRSSVSTHRRLHFAPPPLLCGATRLSRFEYLSKDVKESGKKGLGWGSFLFFRTTSAKVARATVANLKRRGRNPTVTVLRANIMPMVIWQARGRRWVSPPAFSCFVVSRPRALLLESTRACCRKKHRLC